MSSLEHVLAIVEARSSLLEKIQAHQFDNDRLRIIHDRALSGEAKASYLDFDGV